MKWLGSVCAAALTLAASASVAGANATASCWSYEVADGHVGATVAYASINRPGVGAPGSASAAAGAALAALQTRATMTGCGIAADFQQVCNSSSTHADFRDTILVTANAPNGTPVQVRGTLRLEGSINGTGLYYYQVGAHLNGVGSGISGTTGGVVITNNVQLLDSRVWTLNLVVGGMYILDGNIDSNVGNRVCAGGTNTCEASLSQWQITLLASTTVELEVLTPGIDVHLMGTGGHNYLTQPVSVDDHDARRADLAPAFPNPSRDAVDLALTLTSETAVDVAVFDVAGRRVATLSRGALGGGTHTLRWDGRDADGHVARGLFFVRARGTGIDLARRVVLVR